MITHNSIRWPQAAREVLKDVFHVRPELINQLNINAPEDGIECTGVVNQGVLTYGTGCRLIDVTITDGAEVRLGNNCRLKHCTLSGKFTAGDDFLGYGLCIPDSKLTCELGNDCVCANLKCQTLKQLTVGDGGALINSFISGRSYDAYATFKAGRDFALFDCNLSIHSLYQGKIVFGDGCSVCTSARMHSMFNDMAKLVFDYRLRQRNDVFVNELITGDRCRLYTPVANKPCTEISLDTVSLGSGCVWVMARDTSVRQVVMADDTALYIEDPPEPWYGGKGNIRSIQLDKGSSLMHSNRNNISVHVKEGDVIL